MASATLALVGCSDTLGERPRITSMATYAEPLDEKGIVTLCESLCRVL
jgi:hypothetical protein